VPELPDITVYLEHLEERCAGQILTGVRIAGPALLRSVDPPIAELAGKRVLGFRRLGKRVVFELEDDLFLVVHLMIAGRFHWKAASASLSRKVGLAAFDFEHGTLLLTEASPKKRASLYAVRGEAALAEHEGNVTRAAKAVGMQRPNFQNMMKKHGITLPRRR